MGRQTSSLHGALVKKLARNCWRAMAEGDRGGGLQRVGNLDEQWKRFLQRAVWIHPEGDCCQSRSLLEGTMKAIRNAGGLLLGAALMAGCTERNAPTAPRVPGADAAVAAPNAGDRKSTRLNSSHLVISYAVFC